MGKNGGGTMKGYVLAIMLLLAGCNGGLALELGEDQDGRPVSADGKWLVINYWAQWCSPCQREVGELSRLHAQVQGQPVQVLGVSFDPLEKVALREAMQEMGIDYPVLVRDPASQLGEATPRGLPMTLLVDPQGRVQQRLAGEQTADGVRAELVRLGAPLR